LISEGIFNLVPKCVKSLSSNFPPNFPYSEKVEEERDLAHSFEEVKIPSKIKLSTLSMSLMNDVNSILFAAVNFFSKAKP
jgi:hypothetical protein